MLDPERLLKVMPVSLYRDWLGYFQLQHNEVLQQSLEADVKGRVNG